MATQIKRMARTPADCPVTERRQPHCGQDTNYNFRSLPPDGRRDQALHIQHSHVLVLETGRESEPLGEADQASRNIAAVTDSKPSPPVPTRREMRIAGVLRGRIQNRARSVLTG